MENHAYSEIRLLNKMLLGIFIAANLGYFLSLNTHSFPGLSYLGIAIGLAIILRCWIGKGTQLFIFGLIASTIIFTIAYEWNTIFN
ncbi:hypothetical protein V7114_22220 [Neobacillus niacini]|uniref:hypothetical protein n=1 Tax=Neobacillus niacini TaxID=86668 RepID=UPI002FFF6212